MIEILLPDHPLNDPIPLNYLANEIREVSRYSHKAMKMYGRAVSGKCKPPDERGRIPLNCYWDEVYDS